mgnify:CR=1 FL=1
MMRAEVDGDRLSHDELLTLACPLLMAGTDTTRNQLQPLRCRSSASTLTNGAAACEHP